MPARRGPALQTRFLEGIAPLDPPIAAAHRRSARGRVVRRRPRPAGRGVSRGALPQRTLVARPLLPACSPPRKLPTARPRRGSRGVRTQLLRLAARFGERAARAEALRPVLSRRDPGPDPRPPGGDHPQDAIEANLRQEETLLRFLGLVPRRRPGELYYELLGEQLAGFYDIDRREMVLADWLSPVQLAPVVTHELAHALQDQHFSLRVRKRSASRVPMPKRPGTLSSRRRTAVMAERELTRTASTSGALRQQLEGGAVVPAARAMASGFGSERFRAARKCAEDLAFPRPRLALRGIPLHERRLAAVDAPTSIHRRLPSRSSTRAGRQPEGRAGAHHLPDLRGLLGETYTPVASGVLGEHELTGYWRTTSIRGGACLHEGWAAAASRCTRRAGHGGARATCGPRAGLVWDSEDDA